MSSNWKKKTVKRTQVVEVEETRYFYLKEIEGDDKFGFRECGPCGSTSRYVSVEEMDNGQLSVSTYSVCPVEGRHDIVRWYISPAMLRFLLPRFEEFLNESTQNSTKVKPVPEAQDELDT